MGRGHDDLRAVVDQYLARLDVVAVVLHPVVDPAFPLLTDTSAPLRDSS